MTDIRDRFEGGIAPGDPGGRERHGRYQSEAHARQVKDAKPNTTNTWYVVQETRPGSCNVYTAV